MKLLYMTLLDMWVRAQDSRRTENSNANFTLLTPDTESLIPIVSDIYGTLLPVGEVASLVLQIKQRADALSARIRRFHQASILPLTELPELTLAHNQAAAQAAEILQDLLNTALDELGQHFGFGRELVAGEPPSWKVTGIS